MSEPTALAVREKEQQRIEGALTRLDRLARLMDDQFELPLIKVRVGLDPIIGLIPGGGDWVSWMVTIYILFEALRLRVPARVLFGIGWNATADLVLGYAPGVGDIIDVVYKSNRRSVKLIFEWFEARPSSRSLETIEIPIGALSKPKAGPERWLIAGALLAVLTALAAVPIALLWWWLSGSG